jgi:hypothetical protein
MPGSPRIEDGRAQARRSPLPQSPLPVVRRARAGFTGPSADPHEQLLAGLREHVLADVLAGHSLDEVDDWLDGVADLGREDQAALWLYGWVSADRRAFPARAASGYVLT